jgi:ribosome maturation factor RimP
MADAAQIRAIVEPVVTASGFALVRVAVLAGPTIQIMAEDPGTGQLTLDQCADISRAIDPVLEEADPIEGGYRLEVSSPGIDRPLTRAEDWVKWQGHEARAEMIEPVQSRKRFHGPIVGLDGDAVRLDVAGLGEVALPLANIRAAKLVLTDALIAATKPLSPEGADSILKDRR